MAKYSVLEFKSLFIFGALVVTIFAAPPRGNSLAKENDDSSTLASFSDDLEDQNSLWDEDDDEFDFDDVWMKDPKQRTSSHAVWGADQASPHFDDIALEDTGLLDQNMDHEDSNDIEEEEDVLKQNDSLQDSDMLSKLSDHEESENDGNSNHIKSSGTSSNAAFVVNEILNDDDDDDVENYDLMPYSENDDHGTDESSDDEHDNDNVFGDEKEAEAKRLFEDGVFLF